MSRSGSTARSALAALSQAAPPADDTVGWSRRRFIQMVAMGVGAGLTGTALVDAVVEAAPDINRDALDRQPLSTGEGILVIVGMYGGNDSANTVVEHHNGHYYDQRGPLAIPGDRTLRLDATRGLNDRLPVTKRFWDAGQLAIVQGIGYPEPDFSHFNSLKIWMSAHRHGLHQTGWIGRWLDERFGDDPDPYRAASVGSSLPLHMVGARQRGSTIGYSGYNFGGSIESWDLRMYEAVEAMARPASRGELHDLYSATLRDQIAIGRTVKPFVPDQHDDREIVAKLEVAARLINADVGFRVIDVGWHNFDQHADLPINHPGLLADFDAGLERFFATLSTEAANNVTVMTWSEFGRTPFANDAQGTDHGSAGTAFVFGANVRGGFHGAPPSLAGLGRWDRPAHTVDFRSMYANIVDSWLGGDSTAVLGQPYEQLDLFERAPGTGSESTAVPGRRPRPAPTARFVPLAPQRILDTRNGRGDVLRRRIGPGETIRIPVAGRGGVAQGASAVIANVTATGVTQPTYFTAFPTGAARPKTSTLNPAPGSVRTNATIMPLGSTGEIDLFNHSGEAHVIVDVFGYLDDREGDPVASIPPARLLDTRDGTGGVEGMVPRERRIDVPVAGRGGVPADGVSAVILNLAAVNPTSAGYVVTGASGEPLPETSNVNFAAGDIVPNFVVCRVGADGRISLRPHCDAVHLVADVFGWFGPAAGGRFRPVTPRRLLDTRVGHGAPERQVGAIHKVRLQVTGVGDVPHDASAAVLNVSATRGGRDLYVQIWPSDSDTPDTASLNVPASTTVGNLVICRLGPRGQIDLASPVSNVDLIADLVGYVVG